MTHDEFWAKVRAKGPWRIVYGQLRNKADYCPLAAALGLSGGLCGVATAAEELRIPIQVAGRIAMAADSIHDDFRPLLLRELGLAT